ncbi:hypothetical protein PVK06_019948 [Gossypium arboreum]|uniref:Uncharacterized protein n=1 Tax=Gossypium arboreum TaxID=29729 RepID=A0ABR0PLJ8_GOSAR|nr:hypothetical protein PVK06_019948 [Gossypium arboreum]
MQAEYLDYVRSRDLALRKSLYKNFTKPRPEFPLFPATLLPFIGAAKEPTQAIVEAPTQPAVVAPTQTTTEETEKAVFVNSRKEEEGEKDDTATIATTKGKDPVSPSPPSSYLYMTATLIV